MDSPDLHYLAAYIDGEGCLRMKGNHPILEVVSTYPHILENMRRAYGGSIRARKKQEDHHRQTWVWEVKGTDLVSLLWRVVPHLGEKELQAHLVLEISQLPQDDPRRHSKEDQLKGLKRIEYTYRGER